MRRPFGIQLLAALLTFYAMSGVLLALTAGTTRAPGLRWSIVTAAGALFALSAGASALAVWRLERRAPLLLRVCGVVGLGACLAMPLALGGAAGDPRPVWRAAVAGGVLFLLFLLLVARYVRREVARAA
jgi:hypothetical protein